MYAFHEANGGTFDTTHDARFGPVAKLSQKNNHVICSDFLKQAIDTARANLTGNSNLIRGSGREFTFKQSGEEDMAFLDHAQPCGSGSDE